MKITFFLTQDIESPSGLGRFFPLAKELSRLDHQVKIICLHSNYFSLKYNFFSSEIYYMWINGPY